MRFEPISFPIPKGPEYAEATQPLIDRLAKRISTLRKAIFGGGGKEVRPVIGGSLIEFRPSLVIGRGGGGKSSKSLPMLIAAGIALSTVPPIIEVVAHQIRKRKFVQHVKDLMENDETIKQYPKEKVILYADTLFSLNPDLAMHKEVLRSFLRSSLAMDAIDPNFARNLLTKQRREHFLKVIGSEMSKKLGQQLAETVIGG